MSLYDVASLSGVPSLSTAVLNAVINLSNLSLLNTENGDGTNIWHTYIEKSYLLPSNITLQLTRM
jgi:hypothetical protein